jgi:hypothetical protein
VPLTWHVSNQHSREGSNLDMQKADRGTECGVAVAVVSLCTSCFVYIGQKCIISSIKFLILRTVEVETRRQSNMQAKTIVIAAHIMEFSNGNAKLTSSIIDIERQIQSSSDTRRLNRLPFTNLKSPIAIYMQSSYSPS